MSSTVANLRPEVLAARARLLEGRRKLSERHIHGSPGIQVCNAIADLRDSVITELYRAAVADLGEPLGEIVSLVANGGYGRRDVAPFSDVDLLILHEPRTEQRIKPLAERLLRDLFDTGLTIGHAVRTPEQCNQLSRKDATICTTLMESRYICGNEVLCQRFVERFRKQMRWRRKTLLASIVKARNEERFAHGDTVYQLEPNIKRSPGGLRDMHLLRWVGFAMYGSSRPDELSQMGLLTHAEYNLLLEAQDFLLRLRNEMHFHAGKPSDVLTRFEQVRLAEWLSMKGSEGLLPVEEFMREYFVRTSSINTIVSRFLANAQPPSLVSRLLVPLVTHQVEGDFRAGRSTLSATKRGAAKLRSSLSEILRLFDLANLYDKSIDHETCEIIRDAVPKLPDELTKEASDRFMNLLREPIRLGPLLRLMYDLGVLEKVIPDFSHVRCLLQFNEYHRYTVDEHTLRAIEQATALQRDRGPLGRVYRRIKRKDLLHLALLLHDVGKGYTEDHSEVGFRIAGRVAERLRLSASDAETVKFLVHKHLVMAHTAFRRDTSDDQLIVKFAVDVGSPDVLQMLYVLTAADNAAVGPDRWDRWKEDVLTSLYHRTLERLAEGDTDVPAEGRFAQLRDRIREQIGPVAEHDWFERQVRALPTGYLQNVAPQQIAAELRDLKELREGEVRAQGRWHENRQSVEYTICTNESIAPGVFHRLTGALTAQGLQIRSAEINTLADGLILDRFWVLDPDFAEEPSLDRIVTVCRVLEQSLTDGAAAAPAFRRLWQSDDNERRRALFSLPARVKVDNSTSDRYTIIDVFALDRLGLLYTITRSLFEKGLSVGVAKIGTYMDQVVDVFYVTDNQGRKIENPAQINDIKQYVLAAIEALEQSAAGAKAG